MTLVGDAGLSPGPAIGASTSLAVVSAYVLAGQPATSLPNGLTRWLATLNSKGIRLFDSFPVRDYQPRPC